MAKLAMSSSKSIKLKGVASRTSAAPLVSGVEQLPAALHLRFVELEFAVVRPFVIDQRLRPLAG